ncbi:anthranilate phosphoribosyltransferase [Halobacteriales archaeon QS_9_68_17]|nr:MAG: anthranilate phosphoribosyltransferase [Halobacteriales archaeon QS_9_68_17]
MQEYIERVTDGADLTQSEAREAATAVFEEATEAQIGALLAALRAKGETETEIAGFAEGMRDAARTIDPDRTPLVDTCGTGGDDYDTINVSTTSAIVASGAGVPVAKHGNYSVSSSSGSADVLEEVGVNVEAEPPTVETAIEEDGIGFMLAPVFHPAMEAVIGPRKELGMRTIFNVLGPLTNPAGADAQIVGAYDPDLVPVLARALARMDVETPAENAADMKGIVEGDVTGAKRDIILANAGAAVYVAGEADSLEAGVDAAREAIDSGEAAKKLADLQSAVAK